MIRALKVSSEDLDTNLTMLQDEGAGINQIIPCPESMSFDQMEKDTFGGAVKMNFMVIYSESKDKPNQEEDNS